MKKKKRTILFVLIFLVITSLQVLVNPTYSICVEQKGKSLKTYPTTPEGVVEAFVRAYFDGVAYEDIGDPRKILQYTTWGDRYPNSEVSCIVEKFEIIKWVVGSEKATVKVVLTVIGMLTDYENLEIEKGEAIGYYELLKGEGLWKISSPAHGTCCSVSTAIKIFEQQLIKYKDFYRNNPWKAERIRENIRKIGVRKIGVRPQHETR